MVTLRYGSSSSVELEFDRCTLVAECGNRGPCEPLDVAVRVNKVLDEPVGIPALAQCLTPSDQIVVALEEGVPDGGEIAAAVVQYLVDAGVDPDGIVVLRCAADAARRSGNCLSHLPEELQRRVRLVDHDPRDQSGLAFLATSKSGNPIWFKQGIDGRGHGGTDRLCARACCAGPFRAAWSGLPDFCGCKGPGEVSIPQGSRGTGTTPA